MWKNVVKSDEAALNDDVDTIFTYVLSPTVLSRAGLTDGPSAQVASAMATIISKHMKAKL